MSDLTCAGCPWGKAMPDYGGRVVIQCRRHPSYVVREADDWCGENPLRALANRIAVSKVAGRMEDVT